jgi:hypothetical protein
MGHMQPGIGHGSKFVDGVDEARDVRHLDVPGNRDRFLKICLLYSWTSASDHQYNYAQRPTQLVYSMDHGYFFTDVGSVSWTTASLNSVNTVALDPAIANSCQFAPHERKAGREMLEKLNAEPIARAVAMPRDEWGISLEERVAMAGYLDRRRRKLIELLAA